MPAIRNFNDLASGAMFLATAIVFGAASLAVPLGNAMRMGPGYFPLALSILLGCIGAFLVGRAFTGSAERAPAVAWRGLAVVCLSAIVFAVLIRPAGFAIAVGASAAFIAVASRQMNAAQVLVLTAAIVAFCWLVFIKGLGLPWPVFGPWVSGLLP